ncbi:MAG: hypothetical protein LHV69_11270, partial [Elusimicrobia bacterium]|nr:hypothetical protein [Candidatus Obscuribacterium magneticum]
MLNSPVLRIFTLLLVGELLLLYLLDTSAKDVRNRYLRTFFFILLPVSVAFFIVLKVFILPECFAFDIRDDSGTFARLFVAKAMLLQGKIPMMNLFENFGTPILGDAMTYPFSPQSVTYYFLPDSVAMTFNRFAIGLATMILLIVYYRKYLSRFTSVVCAFLAIMTPGFLWHFAHHHYQMALLMFVVVLLVQRRFSASMTGMNLMCLQVALTVAVLGISANVIAIMFGFIVLNQYFESGNRLDRRMSYLMAAMAGAFLFSYPQTVSFVETALGSVRRQLIYDYSMTMLHMVHAMAAMPTPNHISVGISYTTPIIFFALLNICPFGFKCRLTASQKKYLVLGIVPFGLILFHLWQPDVLLRVPFVRATDLTRFLWFSSVFFIMAAGHELDNIRQGRWTMRRFLALLIMSVVFMDFYKVTPIWSDFTAQERLAIYFLIAAALLGLYCFHPRVRKYVQDNDVKQKVIPL